MNPFLSIILHFIYVMLFFLSFHNSFNRSAHGFKIPLYDLSKTTWILIIHKLIQLFEDVARYLLICQDFAKRIHELAPYFRRESGRCCKTRPGHGNWGFQSLLVHRGNVLKLWNSFGGEYTYGFQVLKTR